MEYGKINGGIYQKRKQYEYIYIGYIVLYGNLHNNALSFSDISCGTNHI